MAAAKNAIKESLLGTETEPELSGQTKSTFDRNARQDEASEEAYMTEEDFVNAIAPDSENYVCDTNPCAHNSLLNRQFPNWEHSGLTWFSTTAQDKTGTIRHTLPNR